VKICRAVSSGRQLVSASAYIANVGNFLRAGRGAAGRMKALRKNR
jgi:hypothetical protein